MLHTFVKNLNINGFNACISPNKTLGYNGIVRRQILLGGGNPSVRNEYFFFTLDTDFKVIEISLMKDTTNRTIHCNFTTGIEDARFVDDESLVAVTLDTNDRWKTEVSYIQIHPTTHEIVGIVPLFIEGFPNHNEKNWIVIEKKDGCARMLYSCNPLRLVDVDLFSGRGRLVKEYSVPNLEDALHTGSILKLDDGYLVTARKKSGHSYKHSRWMLFDSEFNMKAYSDPFRFHEEYKYVKSMEPLEYNTGSYEMCMSMHREDDKVVACVSVDDRDIYVYKYKLEDLLKLCVNATV